MVIAAIVLSFIGVALLQVYAAASTTTTQTIVTLTLNQSVCLSLPSGQNATSTWNLGSCTLHASSKISPFFLTNQTTKLIIPTATILNLNSGYGFANYGTLNNSAGSIVIAAGIAYINYGTTLNYHSVTLNGIWAQLNTTSANALTGLFTNQASGTVTISSTGHFNNYNSVINLGTFTNSGDMRDCTVNGNFRGSVTGTISGNAVTTNC